MAKSIPLSPKHGLNPTIPVCAWCGEAKNEIALLGKIKTDKRGEDPEAPMHCILDYEPCDKCKEQWSQGIACIEVSTYSKDSRPPIQSNPQPLYPTGRVAVLKEEAARNIFIDEYKKGQKLLLEDEVFEKLFGGVLDATE